jgi:acetyl esterase
VHHRVIEHSSYLPEALRLLASVAPHGTEVYLDLPHSRVRALTYQPAGSSPRPVLLWLHGGAFVGGAPDDIDATCSALASKAAVHLISLDYRLAPQHPFPAALEDTRAAIRWVRSDGHALGGNGRVFVGGQSAGANLAAAACLAARDDGEPAVDRQVLCYPWLDSNDDAESRRRFDGKLFTTEALRADRERYLAGQPVHPHAFPLLAASLRRLPPALVLGAGMDPLRDDARTYAARLDRDGVDCEYLEYADTLHAFLNFPEQLSAAQDAIGQIAAYLLRADAARQADIDSAQSQTEAGTAGPGVSEADVS